MNNDPIIVSPEIKKDLDKLAIETQTTGQTEIFTPSHAMKVHFPDGTVKELNRQQRRRMKLYGKNVIRH